MRAKTWLLPLARLLALVLVLLPVALSTALPLVARLMAGPRPHVCHCAVSEGHVTCACPICMGGHVDDDDAYRAFSEQAIRGTCGEDDEVFGGVRAFAVLPTPVVLVAAKLALAPIAPPGATGPPDPRTPPPTPPPRRARV